MKASRALISELELGWSTVVLQPTSLCNLNCSYCYLPDRREKAVMSVAVARRVAEALARGDKKRLVLWHGGEPLVTGLEHFEALVAPFEEARSAGLCAHSLQTNATLINDAWIEFLGRYSFRVGVSLDGGARQNSSRVDWSGRAAFDATMRGLALLRAARIPFGIIAVVNAANIDDPEGLYDFLSAQRPSSISISVEEREGLNVNAKALSARRVDEFWRRLLTAWVSAPLVSLRQFRDGLEVIHNISQGRDEFFRPSRNVYPTIAANGDVVMLSPELMAAPGSERSRFVIGNVLRTDLSSLVEAGYRSEYVAEFFEGVRSCQDTCSFFPFCRGGQASNKYFEHGTLEATETDYCRNSRIAPARALIGYLEGTRN
jgi:uncharacterized protein